MIIAKVSQINFIEDGDKHLVNYAELGRIISSKTDFSGNIMQAVGNDLNDAIDTLVSEVRGYLERAFLCRNKKVDFSDFTMDVRYEEVAPNGRFWGNCSIMGPEINLSTGKKAKT